MAENCIHGYLKNELLNYVSIQNIERFQAHFTSQGSEIDKMTLDHLFREVLQQMVINEATTLAYCLFLDFNIHCVKQDICSPSTFFILISDLFDMVTLDVCSEMFCFIEEKVDTWKCDVFYNAGKNYLLRMCNDLLRRMSRAKNTVFCGRIQLFLARLFPLEEKSGLNLMSNFNVENLTVYNMDVSNKSTIMADELVQVKTVDYNLYKKFWSLQNYFHKPVQCFDKNAWKIFIDSSEEVLGCFESFKLEDVKVSHVEKSDSFFAKYLTSDKLLNLQLSDSNFRRNVLLQFLVIFQYLTSHVRFKLATHILNEDQMMWVKRTNERIFKIISETPPGGVEFNNVIDHILEREENWNSWKNEGCSSFIRKKNGSKNKSTLVDRKRKRSLVKELRMDKAVKLGNSELTKLWNLEPDNALACKSRKRNFMANFDEFFREAIEQLDPSVGIEDQYKMIYDSTYAWKSLRLLAAKSPHFFAQHQGNTSSNPIKSTPQYLEQIISKHAKDITSSNNPKVNDLEENIVEYGASGMKKEAELNVDHNSNEQYQTSFEQNDELMSLVRGNWRILAACLELSEEKINYYEQEELDAEQIFAEIVKSNKGLICTITPKKVENIMKEIVQ